MVKSFYQKLVESYLPWILIGFFWIGSILDTLSNTIIWITPIVTYIGSALILFFFIFIQFVISKLNIKWKSRNRSVVINTLGNRPKFVLIGVLLAIWFPRLIDAGRFLYYQTQNSVKYNINAYVKDKDLTILDKIVEDLDGDGSEEIIVVTANSFQEYVDLIKYKNIKIQIFTLEKKPRLIFSEILEGDETFYPWGVMVINLKKDNTKQVLAYSFKGEKLFLYFKVYEYVHFESTRYVTKLFDLSEQNMSFIFGGLSTSEQGEPIIYDSHGVYKIIWDGKSVSVQEILTLPEPANINKIYFWFDEEGGNVFDKNSLDLAVGEYLQFIHDPTIDNINCEGSFTLLGTNGGEDGNWDALWGLSLTILTTKPGTAEFLIGCVFPPNDSKPFILHIH